MSQLLEIDANVLSIAEKIFSLTSSVGKRIVGSKWPEGISDDLGHLLIDELMIFNVWVVNREMEVATLKKQVQFLSKSAFIKYCISDDSKHLILPREKLYMQYANDEIIKSLGYGDPLTACLIYLIEFISENNEHYLSNFIDGRDLISIMNRQDRSCLFIASLFYTLTYFMRDILLNDLLTQRSNHVIDILDGSLEEAVIHTQQILFSD